MPTNDTFNVFERITGKLTETSCVRPAISNRFPYCVSSLLHRRATYLVSRFPATASVGSRTFCYSEACSLLSSEIARRSLFWAWSSKATLGRQRKV